LGLILIENFKGKIMKKTIFSTTMFVLFSSTALFAGADAGIEQEVHSGGQVQLNGAGSTLEQDGKFVRFNWRQTSGEPYVSLENKISLQASFTAPEVTESTVLTFRLTTKERYRNNRNKKRTFRSKDFVNVIVLPEEDIVTEPVEPSETNVTTEANPNQIIFNGFSYIPVSSPLTGRIWLDRNLGAHNACATASDSTCFGDYYQWGRGADGHQVKDSLEESYILLSLDSESNKFILPVEDGSYTYTGEWALDDTDGNRRSKIWSKTDGTSICPVGYRVPNLQELSDELLELESGSVNFLKLPNAGYRSSFGNIINSKEKDTFRLWSSEPSGVFAESDLAKSFTSQSASSNFGESKRDRTDGYSVRCIKD